MLVDRQYTLVDFFNSANLIVEEHLSQATIDTVNKLDAEVGAPTYNKTPNFKKNKNNYRMKRKDMDWGLLRNFKTTEMKKETDLTKKKILRIKELLNKTTENTYLSNKVGVIDIIKQIADEDPDALKNIGLLIFEIASTNKFYSKIYAKLYHDLINSFDIMRHICFEHFSSFLILFENIEYIEAEVDYIKFCETNKVNEKRRAVARFFVNLMLEDVIKSELIIDLILSLQDKMMSLLDIKNNTKVVEEISEAIFLMVIPGKKELCKWKNKWHQVLKTAKYITTLRCRDKVSLSSKVIFQNYDMIET